MSKDGEPCAQCGSPLAADQRYCLNCGSRRGGPRVDYRQRMAVATEVSSPAPPSEPALSEPAKSAKPERDYAPFAAVGGIAVLGLMLLVGVLIGRGDGESAPAATPVVVPAGAAATAGGAAGAGGEAGDELGSADSSGGAKEKKAKGGGGETAAEAGAVTASKDQLEELQNESGEEAAKNALKLPDKIATPGEPPPIDKSKPPGGGEGGAVTIE
jgi:hypothetical protein